MDDGVIREGDLFKDPEAWDRYCARRRGMTYEDYKAWLADRDRRWNEEIRRNRLRRKQRRWIDDNDNDDDWRTLHYRDD